MSHLFFFRLVTNHFYCREVIQHRKTLIQDKLSIEERKIAREKELQQRKVAQEKLLNPSAVEPVAEKATAATPDQEDADSGITVIPIVVKGDVVGSLEALQNAFSEFPQDELKVKVIKSGVGEVTEADITSLEGQNGFLAAFNVKVPPKVAALATQLKIPIYQSNIIYTILDAVREYLGGKLKPVTEVEILGTAIIQKVFEIQNKKAGKSHVAGCLVT